MNDQTEEQKPTKIVRLAAQNVMRLTAVAISPDGSLVVVGGQNAQGKTSVLNAIAMGLGGKREICDQPVHEGQEKGHVVMQLDHGFEITRTFTKGGGGTLTIKKDGVNQTSPQKLLDEMTGKLTFDPLAFTRLSDGDQRKSLIELSGLDLDIFEANRKEAYDKRTLVNREIKEMKAKIGDRLPEPGLPEAEVSVSEITSAFEGHQRHNEEVSRRQMGIDQKRQQLASIETRKAEIDEEMNRLIREGEELDQQKGEAEEFVAVNTEWITENPVKDTTEFDEKIQGAEERNRRIRANNELKQLIGELQTQEAASGDLSATIEDGDRARDEAIAAADLPIDGLGFTEDGITYNGIPFSQASGAEQLRVSLAIGIALNPQLKVMLIRDGSLLDDNGLKLVAEQAEAAGCQVWMERVGEGEECSVVIEDGHVKTD